MIRIKISNVDFVPDFNTLPQQESTWSMDGIHTGLIIPEYVKLKFDYCPITSACKFTLNREYLEDLSDVLNATFKECETLEHKNRLLDSMLNIANKKVADLEAINMRLQRRLNRYTGK